MSTASALSPNRNEITIFRQQDGAAGLYSHGVFPSTKETRALSAQAIDFGQEVDLLTRTDRIGETDSADDATVVVSGVPIEVVYQALLAPEPTPEDILREYFLLECD